ncbi:hypothetical protein C7M84_012962 [Penaeus vannamei]|uniref:CCHC-type domain-containing protein n=1 Tax=Penaeus vannamei TaxID=6689 RepID=A0A3R7SNY2_PENVA|nr:hypothetical protein C7M84_012962 [Penaeus vannamei]
MECAQDREIQELRRQLQQRDQELPEIRLLAPSVQHTMTRCQDQHQQPPVINGSQSPPQPLPRSRPHTPIPKQQLYPECRHTYDPQTSLPQQFQPRSSPQRLKSAHPLSQLSGTPFSCVFTKETAPHFKGDTSASQPFKKNQAIESWIQTIENIVKPATSEMFTQAVRANCRGPAELIINSPLFDSITEWDTFKAALCSKFRGTYTSTDFYKVLYNIWMTLSQAQIDFFLQLEGHVYQGYRDHRKAIGDPSELVKRVFLSGIPAWLQDFLSVKEDGSPTQIAETAQSIWNSRNGIRHSNISPAEENPYHPNHSPRGRDLYAMPVAGERSSPSYHRSPVRERWCEYHRVRTHSTSECRARAEILDPQSPRRRCYHCRGPGHLVRDYPFRERQGDQAPGTAGRFGPRSTSRGDVTSQEGNGSDRAYRPSRLSPPDISSAVHLYRTTELAPHSGRFLESVVGPWSSTPRLCAMLDQGLLLLRCARDLGPVHLGYMPCWIKDCCYFDALETLGTLVQYAQALCHAGSRVAVSCVLGTLNSYDQALCHANQGLLELGSIVPLAVYHTGSSKAVSCVLGSLDSVRLGRVPRWFKAVHTAPSPRRGGPPLNQPQRDAISWAILRRGFRPPQNHPSCMRPAPRRENHSRHARFIIGGGRGGGCLKVLCSQQTSTDIRNKTYRYGKGNVSFAPSVSPALTSPLSVLPASLGLSAGPRAALEP